MARLEVEIGAKSTQFREEVEGLPPVVSKGFKQMKQDSEGGIGDNIKGLKKGFNELKELVVAGGIVEGVKRFFDVAIEAAKKSTDANDQNAAAVRRFGESIESAKSFGAKAAVTIVGTFNQIGEAIGGAARDAAKFWLGWGDGAGNLEESEKAARKLELALADTKKHADEWKQLNQESKQFLTQREEAERKTLPLVEQRAILEQKLLAAQRAEQDAAGDHLAAKKAQVDQQRIVVELLEVEKQRREEIKKQLDQRGQQLEAQHKVMLEGLTAPEREKELRAEIAFIEAGIRSGRLAAIDLEKFQNTLAQRQLELKQTLNKEHEHEMELRKKSALEVQLQIADEKILAKSAGTRSGTETEILKLHRLQTQEKRVHVQIEELLEKKITEGLTPAEQKQLTTLIKQDDKLKDQIATKEGLIDSIATQKKAEEQVTSEIGKQVEEVAKLNKEFDNFHTSITRTGSSYESQSTDALRGVARRLEDQLHTVGSDGLQIKDATLAGNYGAYTTASVIGGELNAVNAELALRNQVQSFAQRYGQQAAVMQFGDTVTQRALSDMQDSATKTANTLSQINERLKNSGLFPIG